MLTYSNKSLVAAYRFAKEKGERGEFKIDYGRYMNGREWLRWFRQKLNEKINRGDRREWRKLADNYQIEQRWDARVINDFHHGRRHTGSRNILRTADLRRRYPEVNNQI